jgi:hypothetical protein
MLTRMPPVAMVRAAINWPMIWIGLFGKTHSITISMIFPLFWQHWMINPQAMIKNKLPNIILLRVAFMASIINHVFLALPYLIVFDHLRAIIYRKITS